MGSGVLIRRAIEKHGIKNFSKVVLFVFNDKRRAFQKEKEVISLLRPKYNLHEGGYGGWEYVHKTNVGRRHSEEAKQKMSVARKGRKMPSGFAVGEKNSMFNRKHTEETKQKIRAAIAKRKQLDIYVNPMQGKKRTEESKLKLSEKFKGRRGYFIGRKHTEETKQKMRMSHLGKKHTEESKRKMRDVIKKKSEFNSES
jgi:hypothetical protein